MPNVRLFVWNIWTFSEKKKKKKKESEKYIQENKSWHFIQSILSVKIRKMF